MKYIKTEEGYSFFIDTFKHSELEVCNLISTLTYMDGYNVWGTGTHRYLGVNNVGHVFFHPNEELFKHPDGTCLEEITVPEVTTLLAKGVLPESREELSNIAAIFMSSVEEQIVKYEKEIAELSERVFHLRERLIRGEKG